MNKSWKPVTAGLPVLFPSALLLSALLLAACSAGGQQGAPTASDPVASATVVPTASANTSAATTTKTPSTSGSAPSSASVSSSGVAPTAASTTRSSTSSVTASSSAPIALSRWRGTDWERIPTSKKVVALTFDAGASDAGVAKILKTLTEQDIRATFFITGQFARAYPTSVHNMAVAGYPVGNHSDTHPYFTKLSNEQIGQQLSRADASIFATTGKHTAPLFRFPFGDRSSVDVRVVNSHGYIPFRWTVDSLGWMGTSKGGTADAVCRRVVNAATPGEIALMHVGANPDDHTTFDADALPCIIDGLKAKGYAFVDLPSQLR